LLVEGLRARKRPIVDDHATSHVTFGGTTVIPALSSAPIADVTARVAVNVNGARRTTVGGDAGVRWRW
jgi:hypothetical protein